MGGSQKLDPRKEATVLVRYDRPELVSKPLTEFLNKFLKVWRKTYGTVLSTQ